MEMSSKSYQEAFNSATTLVSGIISPLLDTNWPKVHTKYKEYFTHAQTIRQYFIEMSQYEGHFLEIPVRFLELLRLGAG